MRTAGHQRQESEIWMQQVLLTTDILIFIAPFNNNQTLLVSMVMFFIAVHHLVDLSQFRDQTTGLKGHTYQLLLVILSLLGLQLKIFFLLTEM